jgi:hypothetical protein
MMFYFMTNKEWRDYERRKKVDEELFKLIRKNNPEIVPPHLREHYKQQDAQNQNPNLKYFLIAGGIMVFLALVGGSSSSRNTDGVFESATEKIDRGHADQLTDREKQRIDDVVNWCEKCKKPLRQCPHGK